MKINFHVYFQFDHNLTSNKYFDFILKMPTQKKRKLYFDQIAMFGTVRFDEYAKIYFVGYVQVNVHWNFQS